MKATKKIVGAACALVAAVALSAGSTFAWFASNGTVTASGLQIDVNTSNSYLVIDKDITSLRNNQDITLAMAPSNNNAKVLPSAYDATKVTDGKTSATGGILDSANWYTGKGTSATVGTLDEESKHVLNDTDDDPYNIIKYVVSSDIVVSVATGTDDIDTVDMNVTVTANKNDAALTTEPINIVILYQYFATDTASATDWNVMELKGTSSFAIDGGKVANLLPSDTKLTATSSVRLKVMVYLDGNNEKVTSAQAKTLQGVKVAFKFTDGASTATNTEGNND